MRKGAHMENRKTGKRYRAGVYLRLSREDMADAGEGAASSAYNRAESNSIHSQRELARSFIQSREDLELYDFYVDDGYSGANFRRPGFRRLMEDVQAGKVDCVVVKDLSRFGRDYIEAGRLIQKTFPALHVRFIAITDRFDSLTADENETSLVLPVRNFVNDSYCRDISGKVRSHQRVKREKGEFIGAFAVYGYCKDGQDRNKLVPDAYAARIVRDIFAWRMEGQSCSGIADRLNGMGVLSPLEYKKSKGEKFTTGFAADVKAGWSAIAVKRILTNEIYTGTMVQGRREKINYKLDKCREKPKEEWIRVEGTHEPVVPKEDFDRVQRLLSVGGKAHLFSGLLFCGDCREPLIRRVNRYRGAEKVFFICPTRNRGRGCTRHSIPEEELRQTILEALRFQAALLLEERRVLARMEGMEVDFGELTWFWQEIERLQGEQVKYLSLRRGLEEDMGEGIIGREDFDAFRSIYEERAARIQGEIRRQKEMVRSFFQSGLTSGGRLERFREKPRLERLDRDGLLVFIDRILVYEDRRIGVELRYGEPFGGAVTAEAAAPQNGGRACGGSEAVRGGGKHEGKGYSHG